MRKLGKLLFKSVGIGGMLGTMYYFAYLFYTAYSTPNKAVLMLIDTIGEAHIEAIVLLFFLIISTITAFNMMKNEA